MSVTVDTTVIVVLGASGTAAIATSPRSPPRPAPRPFPLLALAAIACLSLADRAPDQPGCDLAFKKTYPALFGLFVNNFLPANVQIVGYARSSIALSDFYSRISSKIKLDEPEKLEAFLKICTYVSGKYDEAASFQNLNTSIASLEEQIALNVGGAGAEIKKTRVFYMALPPSVFIPASAGLKDHVYAAGGSNRLVVEKPFGKDSESCRELSIALAAHWKEHEIYRIDHYLGKEMVKSLMVLRFANVFFGAIWDRTHINNIQITFKEKFGTDGRGGYFDDFGIIRDIMQNHLLQVLTVVAMERPVSLDAEDIRNEKVKVLRAIKPLKLEDAVLGQYTASADKKEPGYLDDPTVPHGSVTPTYAAAVFKVNNARWEGVPFILKCGKALDESKVEIRVQFNNVPGNIYGNIARNELVVRLQPKEAVYMKFLNKEPGLSREVHTTELDLSYEKRYQGAKIPDAYESLILDCLKGDKSNFVRDDELDAAWKIFTPLLHKIEGEKIQPELYQFGTRGPASVTEFIKKLGYQRDDEYRWAPHNTPKM
ncbi:glucose-6-phosphate dehydrogenase [Chytriomyces sp. MP71]|nr:glucose-6-phosphate dehydrogenase [Chytriomyces sp. MP71]